MSDYAIRVEGLGKRYLINHQRENGYKTLREAISGLVKRKSHAPAQEEFWAVRDLSFDIRKGDVIGVIGRNGAGKSTLLKLLSRITRPTTGAIRFKGRVASLLEVGTGFHPELSGRENIYLNGAIMGMSRHDIRQRFDDIVAFAEVEQFLDTPVKRYSSGMYMRLAFAVAAHLEPDVLLVDEVLAVGDITFQKKCLGKMHDAATREGRTVVFVSHNMHAVARLCSTAMWLNNGHVAHIGATAETIRLYQSASGIGAAVWHSGNDSDRSGDVVFERIWVETERKTGAVSEPIPASEPFFLCMRYLLRRNIPDVSMSYRVVNSDTIPVFSTSDTDGRLRPDLREPGVYESCVRIPCDLLSPGRYSVQVAAHIPFKHLYAVIDDCITFDVSPAGSLTNVDNRLGVIAPRMQWTTTRQNCGEPAQPYVQDMQHSV